MEVCPFKIRDTIIMKLIIGIVFLYGCLNVVEASSGDRSQFYHNCMKGCRHNNCSDGMCIWLTRRFFGQSNPKKKTNETLLFFLCIYRWNSIQKSHKATILR